MSLFQIPRSNSFPLRARTWIWDTCAVTCSVSLSALPPHTPIPEPGLRHSRSRGCRARRGTLKRSQGCRKLANGFPEPIIVFLENLLCCQKPSNCAILMIIISLTSITRSSRMTFQSLAFYLHLIPSSRGRSFRNCSVAICPIRPCLPSTVGLLVLSGRAQSSSNIPS